MARTLTDGSRETATATTRRRCDQHCGLFSLAELPLELLIVRGIPRLLRSRVERRRVPEIGVRGRTNVPLQVKGGPVAALGPSPRMFHRGAVWPGFPGMGLDFLLAHVQRLNLQGGPFEEIASAFLLHPARDVVAGPGEARAVLRRRGRLLFLDRVRDEKTVAGRPMDWVDQLVVRLTEGGIDRRTAEKVRQVGSKNAQVSSYVSDIVKPIEMRRPLT